MNIAATMENVPLMTTDDISVHVTRATQEWSANVSNVREVVEGKCNYLRG